MPSPDPVVVDIVLSQQSDGRWCARAWDITIRRIRVPQAAVSLMVSKLRARTSSARTETVYVGPGTNYGQAGLYQARLFRESPQPKGAS